VAGVLVALLQPLYTLLSGDGELTWRSIGIALIGGLIAAALVFRVPNETPVFDEPGEHAADR
jgi:hypothetical protein